jgi:DNA (cytosine-5)-methyltransferase 1
MKSNKRRPIAVDLCAGAGGMSLGFEQAGFDVLAAVEIDPVHCATHHYNFPYSTVICSDISMIHGGDIRKKSDIGSSRISVVFGGLPCQGFSEIGKRLVDDPRNKLAEHFIRLVLELDADFFVIENVRGLAFDKYGGILTSIIDEFAAKGYIVEKKYQILNAAQFGVPQNRERLFLFGCKEGCHLPSYPKSITQPLKDRKGITNLSIFDPNVFLPPCPTVFDAIGDLPDIDDHPELLNRDWIESKYYKEPSNYGRVMRNLCDVADDYSYKRQFDSSILTSNLKPNHTTESIQRFHETEQGKRESTSRFHKLHPQGVSPTLRAGTSRNRGSYTAARPIHYEKDRCITVREAARLHSYPDWFRFHVTNWHGLRQVGNSVPPLLAKAVAAEIIKSLNIKLVKPQKIYKLENDGLLRMSLDQSAMFFDVDREIIKPRTRKKPL